jgi:hypothetical protein
MRMLSFIIARDARDGWMPDYDSRSGGFRHFPNVAAPKLYIEIETDDQGEGMPFDVRIDFTDESETVLATRYDEIVYAARDNAYVPPSIRIITDRWLVDVPRPGRYEFRLYLRDDLVGWRAWGVSQLAEDPDTLTS